MAPQYMNDQQLKDLHPNSKRWAELTTEQRRDYQQSEGAITGILALSIATCLLTVAFPSGPKPESETLFTPNVGNSPVQPQIQPRAEIAPDTITLDDIIPENNLPAAELIDASFPNGFRSSFQFIDTSSDTPSILDAQVNGTVAYSNFE